VQALLLIGGLGGAALFDQRILGVLVFYLALTVTSYIMFTVWPDTVTRHGTTNLVHTVPLVLYGLFRYDVLNYQAEDSEDPADNILTDRPLLATLVVWAIVCVSIIWR
jgi:hypothetical protein